MSFIAAEDVHHPETQELLIIEGFRYTMEQLQLLSKMYGIDNVKGTLWMPQA